MTSPKPETTGERIRWIATLLASGVTHVTSRRDGAAAEENILATAASLLLALEEDRRELAGMAQAAVSGPPSMISTGSGLLPVSAEGMRMLMAERDAMAAQRDAARKAHDEELATVASLRAGLDDLQRLLDRARAERDAACQQTAFLRNGVTAAIGLLWFKMPEHLGGGEVGPEDADIVAACETIATSHARLIEGIKDLASRANAYVARAVLDGDGA